MKLLSKFLRVVMVFTLLQTSLFAVPADKTQIYTKIQSNGKLITYTINGDEFISWLSSVDGYTLLENSNSDIVYAAKDREGRLIKSDIIASNAKLRSSEEVLFLSSIERGLFYNSQQLEVFSTNRMSRYDSKGVGMPKTSSNPNFLVIMVNFSDLSMNSANAVEMRNQIADSNYTTNGATGSVRDYYYDNSMRGLDINFHVVGPYTLSGTQAYYGAEDNGSHDIRPREMVTEACLLASQDINFSDFDNDGDGYVDMVHVIFAGRGQHNGGGANAIWPHSWTIPSAPTYDGVSVYRYSCSNELRTVSQIDGIGTICHEMGHVLGLPDFYDTDYAGTGGQAITLDAWDLMSSGNYNNQSKTPPYLSSLEREMLGWLDPIVLDSNNIPCTLPPLADSNKAYKINLSANEFFLLENRNKSKWDAYTPAKGMLVFHGDDILIDQWRDNRINKINIDPSNRGFFIVPAYGDSTNNATSSTTFPGSQNVGSFIGSTLKNGSLTKKAIIGIAYNNDSILNFSYFNNTPTLTVYPITNCNASSVTLNGMVEGNDITSMGFEYRVEGTNSFTERTTQNNPLSVTISNLSPNTVYEYRLFVVSLLGRTESDIYSFISDTDVVLTPPISYGFETDDNAWSYISSNDTYFERVSTGSLPACLPSEGNSMLRYNSYYENSNNWTGIISPKILFDNYFYDVKFSIYRNSGNYSKYNEGVEVYTNSSKSLFGATKIGFISNNRSQNPQVSTDGWYEYSCNIRPSAVGETYIILKAVSKRGYNIYIDDFSVEVAQHVEPIITTDSLTNLTHNSVTLHNSFYRGTLPIIGQGVEYCMAGSTTWQDIHSNDTLSPFITIVSPLAQNAIYFLRSYIETGSGRTYVQLFDSVLTEALTPTTVYTDTAIFNSPSSITVYGSCIQGSYPILTSGFQYKPNSVSSWTIINQTENNFNMYDTIENLVGNTTYKYRVFITDYMGIVYGETKEFTTQIQDIVLGEVITHSGNFQSDTIIMRGELVHTGNTTDNIEIGFIYGDTPNLELCKSNVSKKTIRYKPDMEEFSHSMLIPFETSIIYYKTYIKNSRGIYYGDTTSINCLGINSIDLGEINIQIYPNPTNSISKLRIDNMVGDIRIVIRDIMGRDIRTINLKSGNGIETILDLSNSPRGIYFIDIITDKIRRTEKLILK